MHAKQFIFFIILLTLLSCNSNSVLDAYKTIPRNGWHKDSLVSFSLQAPDTTNTYNLFINLRNNNDYPYNNLFLISSLQFPHGKTIIDTLEYKMANAQGEFLGNGFASIKENKLWYKGYTNPFIFTENGTYTLTLKQAIRKNGEVEGVLLLKGITEIGFSVEKQE